MDFNKHSAVAGTHAFLSASQYAWVNYDLEKLEMRFETAMAAQRGTDLHALAHECIRLGVKLPDNPTTMNLYVNDAIGFRMSPEQVLYYSINCYGTADAIGFRMNRETRRRILRIFDLKTGSILVKNPRQLEIYAAIFCLEYRIDPNEIDIELRIYQSNEVRIYPGDPEVIRFIMDKIVAFDKHIEAMRAEVEA
jgi:hypothetical protein